MVYWLFYQCVGFIHFAAGFREHNFPSSYKTCWGLWKSYRAKGKKIRILELFYKQREMIRPIDERQTYPKGIGGHTAVTCEVGSGPRGGGPTG